MPGARHLPLIQALLSVAGAGISVYLTVVHYASVPLVCSANGIVNCERVLTSQYSGVGGVPISVAGLAWFGVSGALALLALARASEPEWLQPLQVGWSLLGLLTVLYLVGVEVLALGVLCAWCTSLHVLIIALLALSILRTPALPTATVSQGTDGGAPSRKALKS